MTLPTTSRRHFIRTVTLGAGVLTLGTQLTGCVPARFLHGVASGDPMADRVVIWTRVTPLMLTDEPVPVVWVVASDKDCKKIVGSGIETTDVGRDFTIKLDVTGLSAGKTYYFRFYAEGADSPVGKLRTLAANKPKNFRMAVVSCSNYPAGYFHVYGEIAKRDDLDVVLHLGDYIYEYGADGYATEDAAALDRIPKPAGEILTLADYRTRYAQYRSDADLQNAHARHSFICVWDDHEITNDAWRGGAENHSSGEGVWSQRKAWAIQAYYEWMPVREPIDGERERLYRSFRIGDLLELYMLDTRVIGRDQQLDYLSYINPATGAFDAARFQADLAAPERTLLGSEQRTWLQQKMAASTATWQVWGQQVLAGRMLLPAPIVTQQISVSGYAQLAQLAQTNPGSLTPQQLAVLQAPSIPYNLDAWDGYFVEREILFETTRGLDKNLVVLAGDTHNAWANNLTTLAGDSVGVEFATPGVSSPGLETYFPDQEPDALAAGVTQLIPNLQYANLQHRGYMVVLFSPQECRAEWRFVDSVKRRSYNTLANYARDLRTLPTAENRVLMEI